MIFGALFIGSALALGVAAVVALRGGGGQSPSSADADRIRWALQLKSAIATALPSLSPAAQRLVLVQAAYESGFGTSKASAAFNYWNLTRAPGDTRPVIEGPDTAYDANGKLLGGITQRFRAYSSASEGVADYLSFVSTTRYAGALAQLKAGSETGFLMQLFNAGFFTLPVVKYAAGFAATAAELVRLKVLA